MFLHMDPECSMSFKKLLTHLAAECLKDGIDLIKHFCETILKKSCSGII